jgi:hypothetical protein
MPWPIKFTPGSKPGDKRKAVSENPKTVEKKSTKTTGCAIVNKSGRKIENGFSTAKKTA